MTRPRGRTWKAWAFIAYPDADIPERIVADDLDRGGAETLAVLRAEFPAWKWKRVAGRFTESAPARKGKRR